MPNERSQTQKAKLIFSDSCHTNNSPEMGMLAEVDWLHQGDFLGT